MYYLYQKTFEKSNREISENDFLKQCKIETLQPCPFKLSLQKEKTNFKLLITRLYFWAITLGKYKIYYLCHDEEVVHQSYLVPKCFKFPFLQKGDYEIGPCVTKAQYRRKGSYCFMLNHITTVEDYSKSNFYMLVNNENEASIKGIEKAGFKRKGVVIKTKFCKNYKLEK